MTTNATKVSAGRWKVGTFGPKRQKTWTRSSGKLRILLTLEGRYRLTSFAHWNEAGGFRSWDFATLQEAMAFVVRFRRPNGRY